MKKYEKILEKRFNKDFTWAYEKKQRNVGILIKVVRNEISKTHKKKTEKKIEEETIRDTGILFELERRLKVESPFHRNFITYEFNGDRDKAFITLTKLLKHNYQLKLCLAHQKTLMKIFMFKY